MHKCMYACMQHADVAFIFWCRILDYITLPRRRMLNVIIII